MRHKIEIRESEIKTKLRQILGSGIRPIEIILLKDNGELAGTLLIGRDDSKFN